MDPILSILIPSVPSRIWYMERLFNKIQGQFEGENVEILVFMDNKKRSIGLKRQGLVDLARGKYLSIIDDDDDISPQFAHFVLPELQYDVDLVTFRQKAIINGEPLFIDFHPDNPNEELNRGPDGKYNNLLRKPFHFHIWRTSIGKKARFPDKSYAEDWPWCEECLKHVKTWRNIDEVLHTYQFSTQMSEAFL